MAARTPSRPAIAIWLRIRASSGLMISVGPWPVVAADPRGDPVDEALAPAGPLDDERPLAVLGDRLDRLALALAEGRVGAEHGLEVALEVVVDADGRSVTVVSRCRITGADYAA